MGLLENLEAQILERKAVDVVLQKAVFEDTPGESIQKDEVEALELSVCGQEVAPAPKSAEVSAD